MSRLTNQEVLEIYNSLESKELAQRFKISLSTVYKIKNKLIYKEVTKHLGKPAKKKQKQPNLSEQIVKAIFNSSDKPKLIADKFNVSLTTISLIRNRKIYQQFTQDLPDTSYSGNYPLSEDEVIAIFYATESVNELASKFNTNKYTVYRIKSGKSYSAITKTLNS